MKPGNKFQRNLVEIDKSLPKITPTQEKWAFKNCLTHKGVRLKSGKITCLDCGHSWQSKLSQGWQDEVIGDECPNCKTKIEIELTRQKNFNEKEYLTIVGAHLGFQVVRNFLVYGYYRSGQKATVFTSEVSRVYIDDIGKVGIVGYSYMNGWSGDKWFGQFSLKSNNSMGAHNFNGKFVYPRIKVIENIKRNGFTGNTYNLSYSKLFYSILKNQKSETLLKSNQFKLFIASTEEYQNEKVEKYWNSIKICIRNNYIVYNARDWFDYLYLLEYFEKDLNNSKYVCPENFPEQHDILVSKKMVIDEKIRIENKIKQAIEDEENYFNMKKKYFSLVFTDGQIIIKVIDKVSKVAELGSKFKHCIFTNEYYKKKESLLLFASLDDKPIETIEFDLSNYKIIQSRGFGNKASKYNKQIVSLVNQHTEEIKRLAVSRKKSA